MSGKLAAVVVAAGASALGAYLYYLRMSSIEPPEPVAAEPAEPVAAKPAEAAAAKLATPPQDADAAAVVEALLAVKDRIEAVKQPVSTVAPTLVAVSKTKPVPLLAAVYTAGQRDFGENYVQEVVEKAPMLPADIRWHFIGHLQSNKVKDIVSIPNLHCVHTVHSAKLATELQKRCAQLRPGRPLEVMVQVNTSSEASKSGCDPAAAADLCAQVVVSCPLLRLRGLMCIGKYSASEGSAAEDFEVLKQCRERAAKALSLDVATLALSMGMSHDFEAALAVGATHVRVGSVIFGARAKKA